MGEMVVDTVDHTILLNILNTKYGIDGQALKWFDSYLKGRSFRVVINDKYSKPSKPHNLDVSVPQGSCAGVSIFNLYCLTLHEAIPKNLTLSGFANDHSVRKSFKAGSTADETETIHSLESYMLRIKSWMDSMWLKMNPNKTRVHLLWQQTTTEKMQSGEAKGNWGLNHKIKFYKVPWCTHGWAS